MTTSALPLPRRDARGSHPALHSAARALLWAVLAVALTVAALQLGSKLDSPAAAVPVSSFSAAGYPVRAIEIDRGSASTKDLRHVPCDGRARRVSSCWVFSR